MKHLPILFVCLAVLGACSPDEPLINSFNDSWRLLSAGRVSGLSLHTMPQGALVDADAYARATGTVAPPISLMKRYRNDVFLLERDDASITVLTADSVRLRATIDLGALGPASDIGFVNATTAYAVHPSTDLVSVIDLTTYVVADSIRIPGAPIGVAVIGNLLGVISQRAARLSIIDSRSLSVTATISVPTAPTFIDADPTNGAFVLVSLGAGKIDADPETMPSMSFVNVTTRSLAATVELTARAGQGAHKRPSGLAMSLQGYAFATVDDAVLRVNARSRTRASLILQQDVSGIVAVPSRGELLVIHADGTTVDVYDDLVESRRATVLLPFQVGNLLALTP